MNTLKFASLSAFKFKPYAITNRDGKTLYVEEAELIRLVSESLRVPYEVMIPEDEAYGIKLPDGNWTGMIGMLERSEVDLALGYIEINEELPSGVNYIYPHVISETTFMGNKPKPLIAKEAIFYPFSYEVWIIIVFYLIFVSFLLYFFMKKKRTLLDILFNLFGSLVGMPLDFKMYTSSLKFLIFSWLTAAFVLSNCYKGVLLSFLTFPTLFGIQDISDLSRAAMENSVACYSYRQTSVSRRLIESPTDPWKAAGECLKRNDLVGKSENYTPEQIFLNATGKKVFITAKTFLNPYKKLYFISKESFFVEMFFIYYSNKFCCPERLNSLISRFIDAGLIEKYRREETFFTEYFAISKFLEPSGALKKIHLSDISGAFTLLLCGWILGFLTLLTEFAVK